MTVIDLQEAKTNLERYAQECQSAPVVVTMEGKPAFELIPIRSDDPDFLDRLLAANPAFRRLAEKRRRESDSGRVSTLEEVRRRLEETTE
jgi:antitoxin (DNA-binding transcriptional repressor) of toxin-antitoxin stability system